MNFHEHKLWQESYVALMDLYKELEDVEADEYDEEVIEELLESAQKVAATIADALTRQDRRVQRDLILIAVGEVAKTRTHLAVSWGRGLVEDETFKSLDDKYDQLSSSLQTYK